MSSTHRRDPALVGVIDDKQVRHVEPKQLLKSWSVRGDAAVEQANYRLDELDHSILRELGHDGRQRANVIARIVKTDATTIARRIHKMSDNGILYYEVEVDPTVIFKCRCHDLGNDFTGQHRKTR